MQIQADQFLFVMIRGNACAWAFPGGSEVKVSASKVGVPGSIPGWGRSSVEGSGSPLQYSCLENPVDGGAWWATLRGVAKSRPQLSAVSHTMCLASARTQQVLFLIVVTVKLNESGVS